MINYRQAGVINTISLKDIETTNALTICMPTNVAGNPINSEIIPKVFSSNLIELTISKAIPVNEFIAISLFGWYEDK